MGGCICDADEHDQNRNEEVSHGEGANEIVGRDVELPGLGDGSEYKGIGKEDSQRNLECLKGPSSLSPWSFCGIWGSLGSRLQNAFTDWFEGPF